nr:unnamed protein product [Spirometra erinaceieuropaei]VZI48063.1 unnamed protein product [Spirometra erinaceieuropaei]
MLHFSAQSLSGSRLSAADVSVPGYPRLRQIPQREPPAVGLLTMLKEYCFFTQFPDSITKTFSSSQATKRPLDQQILV